MTLKNVGLLVNLILIFSCYCEGFRGGPPHDENDSPGYDEGPGYDDGPGHDEGMGHDDYNNGDGPPHGPPYGDHEEDFPFEDLPSNAMFTAYEFDVNMKSNPEHSRFKESYLNITNKNSTLNLTSFVWTPCRL